MNKNRVVGEIMFVCCENHAELMNKICRTNSVFKGLIN
jgi:hypothetical protein